MGRTLFIAAVLCITFILTQASPHRRVPSFAVNTNVPSPISQTAAQCALPDTTERLARLWLSQRGCSGYDSENIQVLKYLGSCGETSGKCYGTVVYKNSTRGGNIATVTFFCEDSNNGIATKPDYCCSSLTEKYCPFNTPSPSRTATRSPSLSKSRSLSPSRTSSRSASTSRSASSSLTSSTSISISPSTSISISSSTSISISPSTSISISPSTSISISSSTSISISPSASTSISISPSTSISISPSTSISISPSPSPSSSLISDPCDVNLGESTGPCNADRSCNCPGNTCVTENGVSYCRFDDPGCYTGITPLKLYNGTTILTQDLKVGDFIVTPDGQAEVIFISIETLNSTDLYGWNGIEPWVTKAHLFPPASSNTSLDLSLYITPVPDSVTYIAPWSEGKISILGEGDKIGKLNNDGTVSIVQIQDYTKRINNRVKVYTYAAWPINSKTRVPTLYMMGYDYVGYSIQQLDLTISATWLVMMQVYVTLEGVEQNGLINNVPIDVQASCWATSIAKQHTFWLTTILPAAYRTLYNSSVPQAPPVGYDGPADEWIAAYKNVITQFGQSNAAHSSDDDYMSAFKPGGAYYYYTMQRDFLYRATWLNWLSFEQGAAVVQKSLEMFWVRHFGFDYSALCK